MPQTFSASSFVPPRRTGKASLAPSGASRRASLLLSLEFLVASFTAMVLLIICTAAPSGLWAPLSALVYLWFLMIFVRFEPQGFFLQLPLTIPTLASVLALVLIEQGSKIPELATRGSSGIYTISAVIYEVIFLAAYSLTFKFFNKRLNSHIQNSYASLARIISSPAYYAIMVLCAFFALALIFLGVKVGFPLLTGTDRFAFRSSLGNGFFLYVLNFKIVLFFSLGFCSFVISENKLQKLAPHALMVFLIMIYFLYGDKFFTILGSFASFYAPWCYLNYKTLSSRIVPIAAAALFAVSLVATVTTLIYSDFGRKSAYETIDKLSGRIVGQGEIWYIQIRSGTEMFKWDGPLVERNIASLTSKNPTEFAIVNSIGPHYYSNKYAPGNIIASIHRQGGTVTFTQIFESISLEIGGWVGLAAAKILAGIMTAFFSLYAAWAIRTASPISAIFSSYLMIPLASFLHQAVPAELFGIYSLKWTSVIVLIEVTLLFLATAGRPNSS